MNALFLKRLKELSSFEFCLWFYIVHNSDKNFVFTQTNKEIANFFNRNHIAISQVINKMAKKGLFEIVYGYRGSRKIITNLGF